MQIRGKQKIDKYIGYLLIAVLLPFTRLLGLTMFRDHSLSKPPRRILFIKLMGIGSLIVASDAIAAMRISIAATISCREGGTVHVREVDARETMTQVS